MRKLIQSILLLGSIVGSLQSFAQPVLDPTYEAIDKVEKVITINDGFRTSEMVYAVGSDGAYEITCDFGDSVNLKKNPNFSLKHLELGHASLNLKSFQRIYATAKSKDCAKLKATLETGRLPITISYNRATKELTLEN